MANTLKFGNGEWYGKKDTILAYNDENYNYKPLPFSFERASSATVVNKAGLIETVGSGEPRIDYKDDVNGSLLLEPQRTNSITYSEDFSQSAWAKSGTSVVSGFTSPYKTENAFKLVESTSNQAHTITSSTGTVTSGATTTKSIIVKPNGRRWILLLDIQKPSSRAWFDLELGVVGSLQSEAISSNIEKLSNGYFRCSSTSSVNGTSSTLRMDIVQGDNITTGYQGDGTSGVYIYAAQLEEGSYPTSYIPTQGSAVTRLEDACTNGGNEQVINSTEGVLYAEISALANGGDDRQISISSGSTSNRVSFQYNSSTNLLAMFVFIGGVAQETFTYTVADSTNISKVALKYKANDCSFYVNGVEVSSGIAFTGFSASTLSTLSFNRGSTSSPLYGNVKDVRVYNTALTDSELQKLTTI